jgi:murein DD-endopeptidase MepM/ murein hydrolase activator NlpD
VAVPLPTPQPLSILEFDQELNDLSKQMADRGEKMGLLESILTIDYAKKQLTPSVLPVQSAWHSSDFGWRIDPFSGLRAFHEGIDFMAEIGTPIVAAAGGVVAYAAHHPEYGNMVEVDHGNGLVTRYCHASKLLVRAGDVVPRGKKIAEVGNTGRSTGTHLHFEVRYKGMAQNPARFLKIPG